MATSFACRAQYGRSRWAGQRLLVDAAVHCSVLSLTASPFALEVRASQRIRNRRCIARLSELFEGLAENSEPGGPGRADWR